MTLADAGEAGLPLKTAAENVDLKCKGTKISCSLRDKSVSEGSCECLCLYVKNGTHGAALRRKMTEVVPTRS